MSADRSDEPPISTKFELLQRLRERRKPSAQAVLVPSAVDARSVANEIRNANECRIARLRENLERAHAGLEEQHSFARLDGFAASRFNRER